jgi:HTH-type transcriptional regulator/antitoxin MqsA
MIMKGKELVCPVCEKGRLTPQTYSEEFCHGGKVLRVDGLEGYQCDTCGADPVFEDQIRRGHAKYQDARRRADGLLTGSEIRAYRKRRGLTQQQTSRIFGGGANAFSKYERGDVIQSVAMDRLIRACIRHPEVLVELADEAGIVVAATDVDTGYVTEPEKLIKAASLTEGKSCKVVFIADYRKAQSATVSASGKDTQSDESSDWEMA